MRKRKWFIMIVMMLMFSSGFSLPVMASQEAAGETEGQTGDVAGAIEGAWGEASGQIKTVVNKVVFPVVDVILAVFFFIKLATAYFDYRKQGQFEWTAPAILFACLVFALTAPAYVWKILGM